MRFFQRRRGNDQPRVTRGINTTQLCPLSVGLYLYPFQTSCVLPSICSSKISHAPFSDCFQENTMCLFSGKHPPMCLLQQKHPLIRQFPEKHHMAQWSLQRNVKFLLDSVHRCVKVYPFATCQPICNCYYQCFLWENEHHDRC